VFVANNLKLTHWGLVLGMLCETVVENGGEWWCEWSGSDGLDVLSER
jgi:hypothetical protein